MNEVDLQRLDIATRLNERERAAFMVGLGYFKAYYTAKELQIGAPVGIEDEKALNDVNWALKTLGEPEL